MAGLFLFACSRPVQQDENKTTGQKRKTNTQNHLSSLKTRKQKALISKQSEKTSEELIYQSRQKKNTDRLVNRELQDIAQKNAVLQTEHWGGRIQNKTAAVSTVAGEIANWGLRIVFDNDIWDNTDYYYTNGLAIELLTPLAKNSPINIILLGSKVADIELNGFSIRQNMYTPTNPDVKEVLTHDRPFSAFLTLGHFRETYNLEKKLHIKSTLDIGVLGPASLGGAIQTELHTEEPVGWQNQIQNSLVINYSTTVEKGLIQTNGFEFNVMGRAFVGTLFDKAGGGFSLRLGRFIPVYQGPLKFMAETGKNSPLQFWFFAKGMTDFVLYDATLQGGLFSTQNVYTISNQEMQRFVFQGSTGFAVYLGGFGIELENFFLTPEFKGGRNFGWGRIKLVAAF